MTIEARYALAHGLLILVVVLTGLGWAPQTGAAAPVSTQALPRVRSSHPYIRAMIAEAQVRSATFRRLVSAIEATDGIVYVEEGACGHGVRACMPPVVTAVTDFRILRVVVDPRQQDWEVMSSIGHELQHALEVLNDRTLRTNTAMMFVFSQAHAITSDAFETRDALDVGDAVRNEIAAFARHDSSKGVARPHEGTQPDSSR
jgi:hypothetical protein